MLELALGVLALFSLSSGLAASRVLAKASGRSLKILANSEAVLLAVSGICCLLLLITIGGRPVPWRVVPGVFAGGGVSLVALGGFAYLIGSFIVGLFSKVPEDD
jgi:hypothetical protein